MDVSARECSDNSKPINCIAAFLSSAQLFLMGARMRSSGSRQMSVTGTKATARKPQVPCDMVM